MVLDKFVVTDQLDKAREGIVPSLGATSFLIDSAQIATLPRMRIIAYLLSPPDARAPVVQV